MPHISPLTSKSPLHSSAGCVVCVCFHEVKRYGCFGLPSVFLAQTNFAAAKTERQRMVYCVCTKCAYWYWNLLIHFGYADWEFMKHKQRTLFLMHIVFGDFCVFFVMENKRQIYGNFTMYLSVRRSSFSMNEVNGILLWNADLVVGVVVLPPLL